MNLKLKAILVTFFVLGTPLQMSSNFLTFASNPDSSNPPLSSGSNSDAAHSPETESSEEFAYEAEDESWDSHDLSYSSKSEEEEEEEEGDDTDTDTESADSAESHDELSQQHRGMSSEEFEQFNFDSILNIGLNKSNQDRLLELLSQRVSVDRVYPKGQTPMHLAVLSGRKKAIRALIIHGANLYGINDDGCTPLHVAAINQGKKVMEILLSDDDITKTYLDTKDHTGHTAYQWAMEKGKQDVADLLRQKGADTTI